MRSLVFAAAISMCAPALSPAQRLPAKPPDPALPPATITNIHAILDKDLAAALASGELAPASGIGVTIGVLSHGQRTIFTYGPVTNDSVYEIGSITKTFTATILAQAVEQKSVQLDEPVRDLLPPGSVPKPAGPEITLLDLSTHHAGFPSMPPNLHPPPGRNPLSNYSGEDILAYLAQHGVAEPATPHFEYSNFSAGLLGFALATHANTTYDALLHTEVLDPLGLQDTGVTLTPSMQSRVAQGHHGNHSTADPAELSALAGCGAIHSTAADMLTYLAAELHPDRIVQPNGSAESRTLPAAIAATHVPHALTGNGEHVALNWFVGNGGVFSHNGATPGFSSYSAFKPSEDWAVVVLSNAAPDNHHLADKLGAHIVARLEGKPAISLAP